MPDKRYYVNEITVQILSSEPWEDDVTDLDTVHYAVTEGHCSGMVRWTTHNMEVPAASMAKYLRAQNREPSFLLSPEDVAVLEEEEFDI